MQEKTEEDASGEEESDAEGEAAGEMEAEAEPQNHQDRYQNHCISTSAPSERPFRAFA